MTVVQIWRIDNLALCVVAAAAFGWQMWSMRRELDGPRKTLCMVVLLMLLRDAEGTTENIVQGNPGGPRLLFSTLLYLLILRAVMQRKIVRDLEQR